MSATKPIEIAIVGGGCAGITTAFELTRPEHVERYNVTVYQMGWRLGGKGASGRGASSRIEEHGLHLWMGFYENSFRLLRECYDELDRNPNHYPIANWKDAFSPDPFVGVADRLSDGSWGCWSARFPPGSGDPGDPLTDQNPFTVTGYLKRTVSLLRTLLESIQHTERYAERTQQSASNSTAQNSLFDTQKILSLGALTTVAGVVEALSVLELALEKMFAGGPIQPAISLVSTLATSVKQQIEALTDGDDQLRQLWQMIDVVLACLNGSFRFGLLNHPKGFDAIDDYDWREWLLINGASEASVNSAFIRGVYDLLFAYKDGDFEKPQLAAGQALRGAVRMFMSYRGSVFWKMKAGMGDVVFAPFYEVLKKRGVKFKFFHRLDNIVLADNDTPGDKPYIESLEMTVQARTHTGRPYDPLITVKNLPCWPSQPLYSQLENGESLAKLKSNLESPDDPTCIDTVTLRVQEDFDFVVLAIGFGAVPDVCSELVERNSRWQDAVRNIETVPTQAFQIWLKEDMASLGWVDPPINLSGFVTPFDTWADMSHLIELEDWSNEPKSVAYFCSVLANTSEEPDSDALYGSRSNEVRTNATQFLNTQIQHLWPLARSSENKFRYDLLCSPNADDHLKTNASESRFNTQFWTANVNPSDRYVQSLPGTQRFRISPLDIDFDNLTVAGDWTDCSHNAGCVESAIMSGRLAAHALSGKPELEEIIAFDHP